MSEKSRIKSTSQGSMTLFMEFRQLIKHYSRNLNQQAENDYREFEQICNRIKTKFKIQLKGLEILEVGCGQRYPHALIFAEENSVTAIDLDVVLTQWSFKILRELFKYGSYKRAAKTIIRKMFFDKKYHRKLASLSGKKLNTIPYIFRMSGEKLGFSDNSFDLIFSKAVFEHIRRIDIVIPEIKRVLKPGGIISVEINLFTGFTGGHNLLGENPENSNVLPWDHLRERKFPTNSYLNELRINDYKKAFEKHFEIISYYEDEQREYEKFLTGDVRRELSHYSIHELLTNSMLVLAKKT